MPHSLDETYFYEIIARTHRISLLIYDAAENFLARILPDHDSGDFLFSASGCKARLFQICQQSMKPKVVSSELNQVWAGVPVVEEGQIHRIIVIGPIYTSEISPNLIIDYARAHQFSTQSREKLLTDFQATPIYPYVEFTRLVGMVYYYHYHEEMDVSLLVTAALPASITGFSSEAEALQKNRVYVENQVHATYAFEQYMWDCVREGKLQKLKRHLLKVGTFGNIGPMGNNDPVRQQKNAFICSVTLATRAAIEGGISQEAAYSLSDLYIQQVETMKDVLPIMTLNEAMLYDFTNRVSSAKRTQSYSKLVNDCCDFVDEHARENINLQSVAAFTGFSADYISRKFKDETGRSINDYIRDAKISEAKSMLRHSDLSLAEISELLSFSTQSFFTQVFKQATGVTPRQFRENAQKG